jgi:PAS domain S-box-containing protein
MEPKTEKTVDEVKRLQNCINDLISVLALPAIWSGNEASQIVGTLLDVLVGMLRLDFAYGRVHDSSDVSPIEVLRVTQHQSFSTQPQEVGRALDGCLSGDQTTSRVVIPNPAGDGDVSIAWFSLGLKGEVGMLVAGSRRADFPTEIERLLLRVAANQAGIGLQEARRSDDQKRVAEELEQKVAERTKRLTYVNEELRRSEAYLAEAQRLSRTGSFGWKPSTGDIIWSDETLRIFEYTPTTKPTVALVLQRVHPEDAAEVKETIERASQDGRDFDFEHRLLMPDGSVKLVHVVAHAERDESGALEFAGAVMDITENKRAEEALRRSERNLAEAQRLTRTGSFIWDIRTRQALYLSDEWYRIYGFDPGQERAWDVRLQLLHQGDRKKWEVAVEQAINAKSDYELEYRIILPDGMTKYVHTIGHPALNSSGDFVQFVGTITDITERKRAEMLLGGEKRLLEMIARGDSLALILDALCRLVEQLASGCLSSILLLDANTKQLRHGAAPSLPTKYSEAIDGIVIGPFVGSCGTAAYRREPVLVSDIATDALWADFRDLALGHGLQACWSTPIVSSAGKVLGTFATYYREARSPSPQDFDLIEQITHLASIAIERTQATQSLQQQANLLEQTHDAILIWEFPRTIIYWNRGAEQLYGFTREEAIGRPSHELLHTEHPSPIAEFESALERHGEWSGELGHTARDGRKMIVESRQVLMREADGRRLVLETNRDITERKRAAEALRQAEADIAHVSRVTTMGELTASLAHEVNQPITAAVTNANTAVRWLGGNKPNIEEAREAAIRSAKDGTRAAEIISRIRLLFKKGTPERKPVDVNEVIREMVVLLRGEATRYTVSIRTELAPDLPELMADRVQLQQVILNLIMNSIDAMKDVDGTRELVIKSQLAEKDRLLLSVSDTGVGLPAQQAGDIFNAFFTTKLHGTGLGLSISRSIVESHGGRLWAGCDSAHGATFHIALPTSVEAQ